MRCCICFVMVFQVKCENYRIVSSMIEELQACCDIGPCNGRLFKTGSGLESSKFKNYVLPTF